MKKIAILLILFIAVTSITSCMTAEKMNEIMSSWKGHHFSDLIAAWGPPRQTLDDGQGGRIMTWTETRSYTAPGQATTQSYGLLSNPSYHTTYTPGQTRTWTNTRTFWVDSNGIITRWAWRGL